MNFLSPQRPDSNSAMKLKDMKHTRGGIEHSQTSGLGRAAKPRSDLSFLGVRGEALWPGAVAKPRSLAFWEKESEKEVRINSLQLHNVL